MVMCVSLSLSNGGVLEGWDAVAACAALTERAVGDGVRYASFVEFGGDLFDAVAVVDQVTSWQVVGVESFGGVVLLVECLGVVDEPLAVDVGD
jgi:hypothetical protein